LHIKRSQADVCAIIDEENNEFHELVIVNDTRKQISGTVVVKNAESNITMIEKEFSVDVNGKSSVGKIPKPEGQHLWLIEWKLEGENTHRNHYLVGKPPFSFPKYEKWLNQFQLIEND